MKKTLFSLLLIMAPVVMFAQLKVNSDGAVCVNRNTAVPNTLLTIGDNTNDPPLGYAGIVSFLHAHNIPTGEKCFGSYNALKGIVNNGGHTTGSFNYAHIGTSGKIFGVVGSVGSSQNGVGVYGTAGGYGSMYGETVNSSYAGYFAGPTLVDGTLTATSIVTPSDITLKENIIPINEEEKENGRTLDHVMNMNVIKYTYKAKEYVKDPDEVSLYEDEKQAAEAERIAKERKLEMARQKHYGLSAQELQTIYPDLVHKGDNDILGINYVELVPILIRSIQELKQKLDETKGNGSRMTRSTYSGDNNNSAERMSGNVLYQNTPNPFKEQTAIHFSLADDVRDAAICIFDLSGKMLKKVPISSGGTSVSINGWELGEGMFLYSLIVNGKEMDTKRMIITQ